MREAYLVRIGDGGLEAELSCAVTMTRGSLKGERWELSERLLVGRFPWGRS